MPAVAPLAPEDREKKGSDHEPRRSAAAGLPAVEVGTYLLAWSWPEVLRRVASLDSLDAFSPPLRT